MTGINVGERAADPYRQRCTAATGSHCPASGLWGPDNGDGPVLRLYEGSIMPAFGGSSALWTLVEPRGWVDAPDH